MEMFALYLEEEDQLTVNWIITVWSNQDFDPPNLCLTCAAEEYVITSLVFPKLFELKSNFCRLNAHSLWIMTVDGHVKCVSQARAFLRRPPQLSRTVNGSVVDGENTVTSVWSLLTQSPLRRWKTFSRSSCLCCTRSRIITIVHALNYFSLRHFSRTSSLQKKDLESC